MVEEGTQCLLKYSAVTMTSKDLPMSLDIILLESDIEEEGNGVVTSEIDNIQLR